MSFKTNKQRMHETRLSWSLCSFAESRHCFLAGPSERNTHALPQWPSLVWAEASDAYGPTAHAQAFSFLFRVALSGVSARHFSAPACCDPAQPGRRVLAPGLYGR